MEISVFNKILKDSRHFESLEAMQPKFCDEAFAAQIRHGIADKGFFENQFYYITEKKNKRRQHNG